jgi:hypothetical protein
LILVEPETAARSQAVEECKLVGEMRGRAEAAGREIRTSRSVPMHHRCACLAQSKQARHHPLERQTFSKVLHRSFAICEVTAMRRQDP